MKKASDYRAMARETLQGRWNEAAILGLVYFLVSLVAELPSLVGSSELWAASITGILSILLLLPLGYVLYNVFLHKVHNWDITPLEDAKHMFVNRYSTALLSMFAIGLIVFVASIFTFGILGVILAFAYQLTPYILEENPNMGIRDAMYASRMMMRGHKWQLFCLGWSFIGWILLAILTAGIGLVWLMPYIYTAYAHFYEDVKAENVPVEIQ